MYRYFILYMLIDPPACIAGEMRFVSESRQNTVLAILNRSRKSKQEGCAEKQEPDRSPCFSVLMLERTQSFFPSVCVCVCYV